MSAPVYFRLTRLTNLDLRIMGYGWLAVLVRHRHFENAVLVLRHGVCISVPVIEVPDKVGPQGIGSPFAVYDIAIVQDMEAELLVALREQSAISSTERK